MTFPVVLFTIYCIIVAPLPFSFLSRKLFKTGGNLSLHSHLFVCLCSLSPFNCVFLPLSLIKQSYNSCNSLAIISCL
jgi:hypothetical protein